MEQGEIILYQPDETVKLEVRMENETVWLTQAQIVELFQSSKANISEHIKNKSFLNERLSIRLQADDLFNSSATKAILYSGNRSTMMKQEVRRSIALTLRYKFNATKRSTKVREPDRNSAAVCEAKDKEIPCKFTLPDILSLFSQIN